MNPLAYSSTVACSDGNYFRELDAQLTELVRLARDPRLTAKMGAVAAGDSRLFLLLNLLHDRGPTRATDLLATLAVDQSTLSRQLTALVDRGLLRREADPGDGRAALVVLTPLGRRTIIDTRTEWQRTLAELMVDWPEPDRTTLLRLLGRLTVDLSPVLN